MAANSSSLILEVWVCVSSMAPFITFGGVRFDGLKWHYNYRLSQFDPANDQAYYIEVFNKGAAALAYQVKAKQDWIK